MPISKQTIQTLILALFLCLSALAQAKTVMLDQVIAVVDNDIIMETELNQRIETISNRLRAQGTRLPPSSVMKQRVLDQLIIESVQLQLAELSGIRISDNILNETIQNIAKSNGMSLEEFERQLALEGGSFAAAREQIRREMVITQVQRREVDRLVRVTEQEIEAFLESKEGRIQTATEYYLGHILVSAPDDQSEDEKAKAKAKADEILQALQNGADFKQTAVAKSDGRHALNGGIIGWRKESELPSIAADIIPSLGVGEPSPLLKTGSGYHIISVLEKRGGAQQLVEQSAVRHILIKPSEIRTDAEAKDIIGKLHDRLVNGEDFAQIAKSNSDDPVSAIDGGSLGWVNPGQMVPAFEQTMQQTKPGELSAPFKSRFGWHVLEVTDRRTQDIGQLVQSNQARQVLHRRKYEEELANWLLRVKGESFIEIKDDSLKPVEEQNDS